MRAPTQSSSNFSLSVESIIARWYGDGSTAHASLAIVTKLVHAADGTPSFASSKPDAVTTSGPPVA